MYKSKIQTWGLDKKLKEHEARAIIHMLARHRGKASHVLLRDRRVEIKAVESHLKRKGIPIDDVLSTDAPHVSNIIICETPGMSEGGVPRCLASPDAFKTTELLCVDVREYIISSFGTGRWLPQSPDQFYRNERTRYISSYAQALAEVITAPWDKGMDQPGTAMVAASRAYSALKLALTECENHEPLPLLILLTVTITLWWPRRPLAWMLSKQLCFIVATHGYGDSHVNMYLSRIFTRIGQLGSKDEVFGNLLAVTRTSIDSHGHILGEYHPQTLHLIVILSWTMSYLYGPEGLSEPLEALLSALESQEGPGTQQSTLLRNERRRLKRMPATLTIGHRFLMI